MKKLSDLNLTAWTAGLHTLIKFQQFCLKYPMPGNVNHNNHSNAWINMHASLSGWWNWDSSKYHHNRLLLSEIILRKQHMKHTHVDLQLLLSLSMNRCIYLYKFCSRPSQWLFRQQHLPTIISKLLNKSHAFFFKKQISVNRKYLRSSGECQEH